MRRIAALGVCGLCLSLSIACDRTAAERDEARDDKIDMADTTVVTESGCLTASGGRYVLTALETGAGATEMYQLVGNEDELRKHVGREVRVTGDAEPAVVADVRETTAAAPVGTSGNAGSAEAQVQTEARTRLETRKMRVGTVAPTGDECAGAAQ
jgi:hypothetical protein